MEEPERRPRRANGDGSIRRRPNGRWEARVGIVDGAGRLQRRSFFATTRAEATRQLREALGQRDQGIVSPSPRLTVADFLAAWLAAARPRLRPRAWERYEEHVRLHLNPNVGRIPLTRLAPSDVQRANKALLTRLSAATVRRAHATLRAALQSAVRERLIPSNPAALVIPPRVERREMAALSAEEARRLLRAAEGSRLHALWVLAVTTGLRQGELLALRWRDVDPAHRAVSVTGTLTRVRDEAGERGRKTHQVIALPKTAGSRRRVEIAFRASEALREHRRRQSAEQLHAGNLWNDQGLVFSGPTGGYLGRAEVNLELARLLVRAGVRPIRFHDLRHTAATLLLGEDVNPKKVSEMLGHSTVAITLDTYSHVLPGMHRDAARAMDRLLGDGDTHGRAAVGQE